MSIKTVPHPPYSPDLAPCDFCLFPKLRCGRYETIEEMKEVVTKVIDTLTQEDIHGAFEKLLEQYNKCIAAGGDYFEEDSSFMCVLSIKEPRRKSLETYFMILVCIPVTTPRVGISLKNCSLNSISKPQKFSPYKLCVLDFGWTQCPDSNYQD